MTLILTEISEFGIAMAADTAISIPTLSPANRTYFWRVYYGATKLRPIPKLRAGISYWGQQRIGYRDDMDTDVWLLNFIRSNENRYATLDDFAILLQNELRQNVSEITDEEDLRYGTIGFHLAGYVEREGQRLPAFYHIHNGQSERFQNINPRIVNANLDFPPQPSPTRPYITRNGDFQTVYAPFFEIMNALLNHLESTGVQIPPPSLQGRAEFLAFQIRAVRDLYRLSNLLPHIGGEIVTLTISPQGIQSYWNPLSTTL